MLLQNLFEEETAPQTVFILDLPEPLRTKALACFKELGDGQRYGDPEKLGGASMRNKGIHVSGLYAGLTEHVGDITHRMTEDFKDFKGLFGNCRDKVNLGISRIEDNDIERQVKANYEYSSDPERDEDSIKYNDPSKRYLGSFGDWKKFWRDAGQRYADAHSKLIVWNEAQWHAREAAVCCGLLLFRTALSHLKALKAHMTSAEEWTNYCGQVTVDGDRIIPYSH